MGLLFLDTINGQRGESPIAGQIKKSVSSFVCVRFDCPLGALAGKLPIFAGCGHGGHSPMNFPRPAESTLQRPASYVLTFIVQRDVVSAEHRRAIPWNFPFNPGSLR
jgi:hypothetical protein